MPNSAATSGLPLRVLQLASHGGMRRGGAVQLARLAIELRRRGHDSACAFNLPAAALADPQFEFLRERGVELAGFELGRRGERARFRRWCLERDFQIVHARRDEALVFAWRALLGLRRPALVAGRGTVYPLKRFRWPWFCFRSRKVRRVTAVAEAVKRSLIQRGVAERKIEVVYGSIDEEELRPGLDGSALRQEWGGGPGAPLVGCVGALVGKKGHDVFFRAARLVRERLPDCRFVCVGAGLPDKHRRLAAELGLGEAVVFTGHRVDMPQVMTALDVIVSSSTKGEGLNGAIRDAMACGRPVVATDVAGNGEILRDRQNGRLVLARDERALAEALLELLEQPERADEYGRAARQTILERFTNRRRGDQVERLYRSLLDD